MIYNNKISSIIPNNSKVIIEKEKSDGAASRDDENLADPASMTIVWKMNDPPMTMPQASASQYRLSLQSLVASRDLGNGVVEMSYF
jgi:hypothetical protein